MPTHPIYICMLPDPAQEVIGKVHKNTAPALKILENEGFQFTGEVDIFEAGPVYSCEKQELRIVRESVKTTVYETTTNDIDSESFLIANTSKDYRICLGTLSIIPGRGIQISTEVASALKVQKGDEVRYVQLKSS